VLVDRGILGYGLVNQWLKGLRDGEVIRLGYQW
jgi:hypothetical protein